MIDLPTNVGPNAAEPYFIDAGGWQVPAIGGGDATRIDHLGSRHGVSVSLPPMRLDDAKRGIHARVWISRLKRGMSEGVRLRFPQPGWTPSVPFNGVVAQPQAAQATLLQVDGAGDGVLFPEGLFVSLVRAADGRRFLHSVNVDVFSAAGTVILSLHPRLRYSPQVGDQVLFQQPTIEGRLLGDRQGWTIELARLVGLKFEIEEIA